MGIFGKIGGWVKHTGESVLHTAEKAGGTVAHQFERGGSRVIHAADKVITSKVGGEVLKGVGSVFRETGNVVSGTVGGLTGVLNNLSGAVGQIPGIGIGGLKGVADFLPLIIMVVGGIAVVMLIKK